MAQVIVRNIDDDIKAGLKQRASQHGWSMEEEVRQILRRAVNEKAQTRTKLGSRIAARFSGAGLDEPLLDLHGECIDHHMELTSTQQMLHERLHEKKVFVFDWDGTILDSMSMKSRNFEQAFRSVITVGSKSKLIDDVAGHYLRLSGRPRKYIFVQILNLLNLDEEQASFERFNLEFEALNKRDLIHAEVFEDAFELLKELAGHNRKIFISSSVPQRELVDLVDAILPDYIRHGISSVLGSEDGFAKGIGHLQWIMKETGASCDQLLVIGDDIADHELSLEAGVDCILVDRTGTMTGNRNNAVSDLFLIKESL